MKYNIKNSFRAHSNLKVLIILSIIISGLNTLFSKPTEILLNNFSANNYVPDTSIQFVSEDTIEIYTDGPNTVNILNIDTSETSEVNTENLWGFTDNQPLILLEFTANSNPVQDGTFGINVSGMFENGVANYNELEGTYGDDRTPWSYLTKLKPEVLRFPSGAGSKFMNLLGEEAGTDLMYKGYGYNFNEMLKFYDKTDNTMLLDYDDVFDDLDDEPVGSAICDNCFLWMDNQFTKDLEQNYNLWATQETFSTVGLERYEMDDLAVNQFIDLIDSIETYNPGHIVDVIVCLDIMVTSASEAIQLLSYMRSNDRHNVNVVGVELGNEVYFKFGRKAMGFVTFDHYWDYITGGDYTGLPGSFDLEDVLPADVLSNGHDYITRIKSEPDLRDVIEIGLPAMNLPNCGVYPFIINPDDTAQAVMELFGADDCGYPEWNLQMLDYYDEVVTTNGVDRYAFDGIILHPYYTSSNTSDDAIDPNTNWGEIIIPEAPAYCIDGNTGTAGIQKYNDGEWDYADMDERLQCAFEGLAGYGNIDGNFHAFIKSRYNDAYDIHAEEMLFEATDTDPDNKDIWTTEWNFLDNDQEYVGNEKTAYSMPTNTFIHNVLLQEWFLKNIKANMDPGYRDDFFKYATIQNFIGGTPLCIMGSTDLQDQLELGIDGITSCTTDIALDYYVPKATYYQLDLLKNITGKGLNFLKSSTTKYVGNVNLPPTVFIPDLEEEENIYVYYSNVKDEYQVYCIDPNTFGNIYDPNMEITLGTSINVYSVDADQLYSNSGRGAIFEINNFYNTCDAGGIDNRFEIQGISTSSGYVACPGGWSEAGGVCVRVPAYSAGYFVIPFTAELREGQNNTDIYKIFPNPASNSFYVYHKNSDISGPENLMITLYSSFGSIVFSTLIDEGAPVNIDNLPVGCYTVLIKSNDGRIETETLVKMK